MKTKTNETIAGEEYLEDEALSIRELFSSASMRDSDLSRKKRVCRSMNAENERIMRRYERRVACEEERRGWKRARDEREKLMLEERFAGVSDEALDHQQELTEIRLKLASLLLLVLVSFALIISMLTIGDEIIWILICEIGFFALIVGAAAGFYVLPYATPVAKECERRGIL